MEEQPADPPKRKRSPEERRHAKRHKSHKKARLEESSEASNPHLCCGVCLSFPEEDVLQCTAGHLLCRECHSRVCLDEAPQCPTCRTALDPLNPVRNLVVEQTISRLRVACPHKDCEAVLTRGTVAAHAATECRYRHACCKYAVLGCKWEGLHAQLGRHEAKCKRGSLPGSKLLKKAKKHAEAAEARHAAELAEARRSDRIVGALSGRCTDAAFVDLTLHTTSQHEHVADTPAHLAAATFHALGLKWKLYTLCTRAPPPGDADADPIAKYSVVVQLKEPTTKDVPVDFFVLRSPATDPRLQPACASHTFHRRGSRHREGGDAPQVGRDANDPLTIAAGPLADALSQGETLHLRLGMVDRTPGRAARAFLGQRWGDGDERRHGGRGDASSRGRRSPSPTSFSYSGSPYSGSFSYSDDYSDSRSGSPVMMEERRRRGGGRRHD